MINSKKDFTVKQFGLSLNGKPFVIIVERYGNWNKYFFNHLGIFDNGELTPERKKEIEEEIKKHEEKFNEMRKKNFVNDYKDMKLKIRWNEFVKGEKIKRDYYRDVKSWKVY